MKMQQVLHQKITTGGGRCSALFAMADFDPIAEKVKGNQCKVWRLIQK